jgi:hypothetical protein
MFLQLSANLGVNTDQIRVWLRMAGEFRVWASGNEDDYMVLDNDEAAVFLRFVEYGVGTSISRESKANVMKARHALEQHRTI